jgi:uncharacterized protein with ParB-like and HNH nuclease domain
MEVTQKPVPIKNFLKEFNFEVPLYQREYSWDLEQISDLFYDIESSTKENGHFLGSLLLYSKDIPNKIKEVIDGQQRLTTLFLILYGIKNAIKESGNSKAISSIDNILYQTTDDLLITEIANEPRLTTGKRDKHLFRAIIKGENVEDYKIDTKSHERLLNALNEFIIEKLDKLKLDKGIDGVIEFANKVLSAEFIVMTAEQESDKILLFKTLNARGIELSQADLIKNEVCNNLRGINADYAIELWDSMREILEKIKANVDLFLFHFINAQNDSQELRKSVENKRNVKNDKDSYPPVPEKYIFDVFGEKLKRIDNTEKFLIDLKKAASQYAEIFYPSSDKVFLRALKTMNITKCYPLLLKGKAVLKDEKNFDILSKAIECISFRHSIIRNDPKELEKFYYLLLNKLNSDTDINNLIEDVKSHPTMKMADKFKSEFESAKPKPSVSKMILQRIISKEQESIDFTKKDIWFEHIMPQTPKGEWLNLHSIDKELYEYSVHSLGNLTFIQDKKNIGASNHDFKTKKDKYYSTSLIQLNKDLLSYDKWDFDTIDERQKLLYKKAILIWNL